MKTQNDIVGEDKREGDLKASGQERIGFCRISV